ncbi:SAM-dependent methyltransferase [Gracilinema caldarium]|uniref:class I SAM-dependent methyltransferase n=1 Tax=Gracilinema caldarium TaxID=215591 RepID=UPI0026F28EBE|nr:SAM-dependent methyltransferase [Gracilinema caldarium]
MGTAKSLGADQLKDFIASLDIADTLVYAVFSRPRPGPAALGDGGGGRGGEAHGGDAGDAGRGSLSEFTHCDKLKLRPVEIKGVLQLQAELQRGPKTFHKHYPLAAEFDHPAPHDPGTSAAPAAGATVLTAALCAFSEGTIFTSRADYQFYWLPSGQCRLSEKPPTKNRESLSHNRRKSHFLQEGQPVPFLVELGVMDTSGRVYPKKYDKFRQIYKYLEFVETALQPFPREKPLYIVDFGSGKAYLTFALYHFLMDRGYTDFRVTGLDLKSDVVELCNGIATRLGCTKLRFEVGDIANFHLDAAPHEPRRLPDMVISLHACDIATDAALAKALLWGSPAILAVPCCQHEFFHQLNNPVMNPIIRFGITRDKQATLVTDASRLLILKAFGYSAEMVEFIAMEHTPKNVLIRANREQRTERRMSININDSGYRAYRDFLDLWGVGRTFLELELSRLGLLIGLSWKTGKGASEQA